MTAPHPADMLLRDPPRWSAIYQRLDAGYFTGGPDQHKPAHSIVPPPPNVTGQPAIWATRWKHT